MKEKERPKLNDKFMQLYQPQVYAVGKWVNTLKSYTSTVINKNWDYTTS